MTGSALIVPFGWRAVFLAVTMVAGVGLVLLATLLPETLQPENRGRARAGEPGFRLRARSSATRASSA